MQTAKNFTHRQTQLSAAKQVLLKKRLEDVAASASSLGTAEIGPRPTAQAMPLSFAQQRLWFLQQVEPESAAYNEVMAARLQGPLNREAFTRMAREILRSEERRVGKECRSR